MADEYIKKENVLKIIYDIKENKNIPKNYGTLIDIIQQVRNLPSEKVIRLTEIEAVEDFAESLKEQITTRIVELKAIKSKYVKENYKCLSCNYIAKIRGEIEFLESLKEFIDNLIKERKGD